jgi:sarcosine oxidase subunit alpha
VGSARLAAPAGTYLDRTRAVSFTFNGRTLRGFAGDTLASALLANGVRLVGRSFKLHRPRGIWSCGAEEPSALVDVGAGARRTPNVRATLLPIAEGLNAVSVNCWPGVGLDLGALTGAFAALLPAGFYYKTFKWPSWQLFEPAIRRMAGLGRGPRERDADRYEEVAVATDVLVVGAGIAGLTAALASAEGGARTMLLAAGPQLGGTLGWQGDPALATLVRRARECGVRILTRTVAFGVYDHNLVCACESLTTDGDAALPAGALRERLWKIRARAVIAATGALERPLLFPDNDRPGVMLAGAAARYAGAFGVRCGERVVIAANSDHAYAVAAALAAAGLQIVAIAERRQASPSAAPPPGTILLENAALTGVRGGRSARGCTVTQLASGRARHFACDLILNAGVCTRGAPAFPGGWAAALAARGAMFVPTAAPLGVECRCLRGGVHREAAATHAAEVGHALGRGQPRRPAPPRAAPGSRWRTPARRACAASSSWICRTMCALRTWRSRRARTTARSSI